MSAALKAAVSSQAHMPNLKMKQHFKVASMWVS